MERRYFIFCRYLLKCLVLSGVMAGIMCLAEEVSEVKASYASDPLTKNQETGENDLADLDDADDEDWGDEEYAELPPAIRDPLYFINKPIFIFNDKLLLWVIKPVSKGFQFITPKPLRISLGRFFHHWTSPVRFVNSLLQFKFKGTFRELGRFGINTTVGVLGFFDPAKNWWHLKPSEEDLGQTLGHMNIGNGFYLVLPVLGPSTLRDMIGMAGDSFLDPINYLHRPERYYAKGVSVLTESENIIARYEAFKKNSLDPYISIRDAYVQHRQKLVEK